MPFSPWLGSSMPGKILITALSSSRAQAGGRGLHEHLVRGGDDSGSGNLLARAMSSTRPRSFTKMSTADSGV
jgi:hypothetical protein